MPPKRYFDDERSAKPGILSDELRAAINLHDDKLPMWIYKMRVLGYPPGWLQQADISNSSLQLFDDTSQVHQSTTSQVEEQAFNPECFVEFPGFNAPVPEGVKDHCEILGMPPMQGFQQLNFVKQTILPPKPVPYKRIKLSKNDSDTNNGSVCLDDDDDEIQIIEPNSEKIKTIMIQDVEKEEGEASDSDDEIIAISSSIEKPKDHQNSSISIISTSSESKTKSPSPRNDSIILISPTKPDLSLPSTSSASQQSPLLSPTTTELIQKMSKKTNKKKRNQLNETTSIEIQGEDKQSNDNPTSQPEDSPSSTIQEQIKSPSMRLIGMGCPTPADIDCKKPPLEKFAVGMGELIYFENLPTSTGVFDKMRHVIFKVRKKLSE
ncbi:LOW QUALITY PROTEIN: zinc finger CCHC domain-containing protein 8-like [Panonychus citri]|uniref:LOW QUALITY PROTEIN: zinc finger CCHC domain-containing protein 8-like n=1 Tax=Panonychus citri TaxID=50023 RepID=UPI002307F7E1|nr:LOW QUALITY PROTEIN: zinc finger CCHC domain-containing protein 8-like [Panonychus citri]